MHLLTGEVVAPELPGLLANLIPLLGFALALAVAGSLYFISRLLLGVIGKVVGSNPITKFLFGGAVNAVSQFISNEAGKVVGYLEGNTVKWFYGLAAEIRWTGHEIAQLAKLSLTLATTIASLPGRAERAAINRAVDLVRRAERAAVRDIRKEVAVVAAGAGSIAAGVLPKLGRLEHQVDVVLPRDVATLREQVKRLEDGAVRTWEWLRAHPLSVGSLAFVGAVAWALSRLGLSELRCNALRNSLRNRGCGLWRGLEDLLGLLFDGVVLLSLCEILPEAEKLFAEVEGPLVGLISGAANAVCARPPAGWDTLTVGTLHLPTSAEIIPTL